MSVSANGVISGKNGLVKVGAVESPNIESWTYGKAESKTEFQILNSNSNPSTSGTPTESGVITAFYDPADATHQAMRVSGTADLNLYYDGEASSDYFLNAAGVAFSNFSTGVDATSPGMKFTVTWSAGSAGVVEQQVA